MRKRSSSSVLIIATRRDRVSGAPAARAMMSNFVDFTQSGRLPTTVVSGILKYSLINCSTVVFVTLKLKGPTLTEKYPPDVFSLIEAVSKDSRTPGPWADDTVTAAVSSAKPATAECHDRRSGMGVLSD